MSKEWPPRCPLPLEAIQQLLIHYLASGRGYDDASVAAAASEGNRFFQQKDFGRALDLYGIAYEVGRLHYAYRPLLHDLLLRRILCHSLLGRFEQALQECHTAAWLIPHEATCQLLFGVIYSKLGRGEEANSSFQQAVATCWDLRDLVDCLIAFFTKQHGFMDRAIRICTQVLKRNPRYPLAMLVRGDTHKCNQASKTARHSATADYTALLELDFSYQAILCRQAPKPANHTRADELLLSFHPFLQMQTPRPYASYALCRRKDPLVVASLVLLAVTKLRIMSTSGKMLRSVQQAYDELLEQRAQLQRKVYGLMLTQQPSA
ncbi:Comt [Symbiodinium natans]|uniref:Comt protein n=1 Tax=Symbiodinium natans TaxID=878477 RepID=A0A812J8L6_9DINO|nr:Comt [Symbiodinium natans]